MAKHMAAYFAFEAIAPVQWSRKSDKGSPVDKLKDCSIILLLISDDAIEPFVKQYPELTKKRLIHFSGSLYSQQVWGMHPLMTFAKQLYSLAAYRQIPFIVEDRVNFKDIFPNLSNRSYPLRSDMKGLYHALCVMSGTFSVVLWQKIRKMFERDLQIPWEVLIPYLTRTFQNISVDPEHALTGPLVRDDHETMKRNIEALPEAEWKRLYSAFIEAYRRERDDENEDNDGIGLP